MMDWTDRHDRFFLRLISAHVMLYTEMVTADAVIHGDRARLLGFDAAEHPVALQLGGSDPDALARAAAIGQGFGYDEINLNVGCPSDRVQSGKFGACLMREPEVVAACVAAMGRAVDVPVTVKCRIGVDRQDPEVALPALVDAVTDAGVQTVIVHARKAWLDGLSPKENRDVPPLDYDLVRRLKAARPDLQVVLNGGLVDHDTIEAELAHVDGAMIGRAAYQDPYMLAEVDRRYYGAAAAPPSRHEVVRGMRPYIEARLADGVHLGAITRHMLGLFQGRPGARAWRRHLSENAHKPGAGWSVIEDAAARVAEDAAPVAA